MLEYFLFATAALRKHRIPAWFRFLIWLAYLGSDAVAIFALAALFNRHKKLEPEPIYRKSASLQVMITIYVFCKSWPRNNENLVIQAILFFLAGALKCFLKPWDLMRVQHFQIVHGGQPSDSDESNTVEFKRFYSLFVDLTPTYSVRLAFLKFMVQQPGMAHIYLQLDLSEMFNRLYTKESQLNPLPNLKLAMAYVMSLDTTIRWRCSQKYIEGVWSDQVAQYNILGYLVRNKKHRKIRKLATLLLCKDHLDQLWCMKSSNLSCDITQLIYDYVRAGWLQINDITTYRKFNDNRGQWNLDRVGLLRNLGWGLSRPFDETILLWHLATEFTFYHMDTLPAHEAARRSREISNYMVYLLFVNPEMLMAGSRRSLFKDTYEKLKDMTLDENPLLSEKEITQNIIQRIVGTPEEKSMVHDAWKIAQVLIEASSQWEDDDKLWTAIQGVWVEMLCFSAGRCRGVPPCQELGQGRGVPLLCVAPPVIYGDGDIGGEDAKNRAA
ncbi:hypothetical protein PR202_ga24956 [Eleusine coracana subsp. coracana]|uniref:DUF4220 domain-containing protein n=1 Tax=Eleusine coracana subsp. coracana TaxID=191504 RepID=A0AAV5D851_ELECO|nr:hypothetical protein PR202_ga24956 [Eleusine coracana subsp. coracana]